MKTVEHDAAEAGTLVLDRYALLEELGSGGFGAVWLARDERLERMVAVKRIPVLGAAAAARAEKEALAAARLSHPAVVSLYEAGRDDGAVYLVSELVRGHTLHELLGDGALSDRDVLLIGMAMCDALAHAHSRGVIHRDVKPGNVLIPESGGEGVVAKLTDFGIARITGDDALTATGDVVGTLAYMAPEQAEGRGATAASDLYSLALCLYEALCGVNPVRGPNAAATARNVGMRLPALQRMRRDLPRGLCAALDASLLADPSMRGSLDSLRLALSESLSDVGDEPGTVEAPLDWAAKGTQTAVSTALRRRRPREPRPIVVDEGDPEVGARALPLVSIPARIAAAAVTAGAIAAALTLADSQLPLEPAAAAALGAALVALLPRVGWVVAVGALIAWLGAEGQPDDWWTVGLIAAPMPLLIPHRPAWWSSPALAVGLGWIGVSLAWPAFAGQARGIWSRAVLGAAGVWALSLAGLLTGERLLLEPAGDLTAMIEDPAMAVAGVWAAAAAVLPFLVRGRNVGADLLAAIAWAVALAAGTSAAGGPAMVGAAALAALLVVLAGALRRT
ncbi:MAG: serine/threonine protein kinase [Solirubrobacterales bacterium]|nr:serine/threonine protein kinase [Solirubrobacterales bacterium]